MGTWGTAILSDDLAKDIYDEYMELYDDGINVRDIRTKLESSYNKNIDEDEKHIFYLALAKAQWECKALDEDILFIVKEIINDGVGLEQWQEQGDSLCYKREKVLKDFLIKIQTKKDKARQRRKIVKVEAILKIGDCITFKLKDGSYGGGRWYLLKITHTKLKV